MDKDQKQSVCEEKVFCEVHETHGKTLQHFLYYKYGSLEKARDCAQEAFIRLWNNCKKVSFDKAKSFLFTVANRLFLDDVKRNNVELKFQKSTSQGPSYESNPEYLFRKKEFKVRLEEAISRLPERQRTVFLMSRIDKMPNKEIADTLDISVKGVERQITGALKKLRDEFIELKDIRI